MMEKIPSIDRVGFPFTVFIVVVLAAAFLIGLGTIMDSRQARQRREERDAQVSLILEVSCKNYNTLKTIVLSSTVSTDLYRMIGFNDVQINAIVQEAARVRSRNLDTLGPRADDCEPTSTLLELEPSS